MQYDIRYDVQDDVLVLVEYDTSYLTAVLTVINITSESLVFQKNVTTNILNVPSLIALNNISSLCYAVTVNNTQLTTNLYQVDYTIQGTPLPPIPTTTTTTQIGNAVSLFLFNIVFVVLTLL